MRCPTKPLIWSAFGNCDWATEIGSITALKNSIAFAATYFVFPLSLFFRGAEHVSVDHLLKLEVQP